MIPLLQQMYGPQQQPQPESAMDPKTVSNDIQVSLGAKDPDPMDAVRQVLAQRFVSEAENQGPSLDDLRNSMVQSMRNDTYVNPQNFADERLKRAMDQLSVIQKTQENYPAAWKEYQLSQQNPGFADYMKQQKAQTGGDTAVILDRLKNASNTDNIVTDVDAMKVLKGGAGQLGRNEADIQTGRDANYANRSGINQADLLYKPQIEQATNEAGILGTKQGEAEAFLKDLEAQFPQIQNVYGRLSALVPTATYTMTGQGYGAALRQLGYKVPQGMIDRTAYMNIVSNETLPLLRQTFGSQFTENEGLRLMATLGDPDKSAPEKQAALDAFIQAQQNKLQTAQRRVGAPVTNPTQGQPQGGVMHFDDLPE